jgi:UDP-N-acetylglucosamine acyltransferase
VIDDRAVVDPAAKVADNVTIGPWTYIGPGVEIGEGTNIASHVVIKGPTKIGRNNKIFQFASLGEDPQDLKYEEEATLLEIGDGNTIREYCNFNRGTVQGGNVTKIGNNNLFMANVHIAHDCILQDHIVMANNSSLAGHVEVQSYARFSGYIGVHQFCQIGEHSFISHGMLITKDVPPYVLAAGGRHSQATCINSVGLERFGYSADAIKNIKKAFKIIYRRGLTLQDAVKEIETMVAQTPELKVMVDFLANSKRGIIA